MGNCMDACRATSVKIRVALNCGEWKVEYDYHSPAGRQFEGMGTRTDKTIPNRQSHEQLPL